MADGGVLATEDRSEPFVWGDFHRVSVGIPEYEDLVQCHRCWLIVLDEDRAAHLEAHRG